jgi:hypothetical protein
MMEIVERGKGMRIVVIEIVTSLFKWGRENIQGGSEWNRP